MEIIKTPTLSDIGGKKMQWIKHGKKGKRRSLGMSPSRYNKARRRRAKRKTLLKRCYVGNTLVSHLTKSERRAITER